MTKDEALKLALEALEMCEVPWTGTLDHNLTEAITAIKEALANDALEKKAENARELGLNYEPEPVAWEQFYPDMGKPKLAYLSPTESPDNACYIPPQRTWVGLMEKDICEAAVKSQEGISPRDDTLRFAIAIEAKLKEKNT